MSVQLEKPKHNQYDNIWEIRQTGYPSREILLETIKKTQVLDISGDDVTQIENAYVFRDVKKFIRAVLQKHGLRFPIWKIVIPRLDGRTGAIYYIANFHSAYNHVFRGTFGYGGTGPHQSALIEACFEKFGLNFEVRDGDYLLQFFYPEEAKE